MTEDISDTSENEVKDSKVDENDVTASENTDSEKADETQKNEVSERPKTDRRTRHAANNYKLRVMKREVDSLKNELINVKNMFKQTNSYTEQDLLNQAQAEYNGVQTQETAKKPDARNELSGYDPYDVEQAEKQASRVAVEHTDFRQKIENLGCSAHVCIAAANYSDDGLLRLYEIANDENFAEKVEDLSDLSPERQKAKTVRLISEFEKIKLDKRKSNATPQPKPIKNSGGTPARKLSIAERRKIALEQQHAEG
jgi:hypothetical protein